MERWNSGIVEWLDGRLTTLYCFAAVTVINECRYIPEARVDCACAKLAISLQVVLSVSTQFCTSGELELTLLNLGFLLYVCVTLDSAKATVRFLQHNLLTC